LAVVLYGYEAWSFRLREERRLRLSENRVLRIIFESKRNEVTGKWRKLHNEELDVLHSSPNIVRLIKLRRMRLAGHVALWGRGEAHTGLVGKPEGKRPLALPRHRWEDNIKVDLQGVGWGDRIDLAQDKGRWRDLADAVMNLRVP